MSVLFTRLLRSATLVLIFLAGVAFGASDSPVDPANFDTRVRPCDDYYQYATGGWTATHTIPPALSSWRPADQLSEDNLAKMHGLMEKLLATPDNSDPDFPRIANFYKACMDEGRIEREGEGWLRARLKPIDALKTRADIKDAIGKLHKEGLPVLFVFGATPDGLDSDKEDASLFQGGLSLPNRDYYTREDDKSKRLREGFVAHVARMFRLVGETDSKAQADALAVLDIETQLALPSRRPEDLRDPLKNYNLLSMHSLQGLSPAFDWKRFMHSIGAPDVDQIDVGQPDFVKGLGEILANASPVALKAYLRWHVIADGEDILPKRFVEEQFAFSQLLSGAKEPRPHWQRCIRQATIAMQDAVGKAFVKNFVPVGTKERTLALVHDIRATLREDIQKLDWMGTDTKQKALEKLDNMAEHIAYPDKPIDYSALQVRGDEIYADVRLKASRFEEGRKLAKIGKPTNHTEWRESALTTNAFYNRADNSINFTAGILMPPYFDVNADDAVNYGRIGVVIGHEMTHGFDDSGRRYDAKGNLAEWWTPTDAENFAKLGQCIVEQFNGYVAIGDVHENGKLEEGEAIADLGGVTIAHRAFLETAEARSGKPIDGLTPEQRFFAAFAQLWEQNMRPEETRTQALVNTHPLGKFRVIGPFSNLPDFAKAYQCPTTAPMVRNPPCKIW